MSRRPQWFKPTPFKAGLLTVLLACLLYLSFGIEKPPLLQAFDNQLTSAMFRWRGAEAPKHKILIVDIDERSLSRFGQWPWPRDLLARVINRLQQQGAQVIGLDIMFIEADRTAPRAFAERYPQLAVNLPADLSPYDPDLQLGKVLQQAPTVLGYAMLSQSDGLKKPDQLPFPSANLQLAAPDATFEHLNLQQAYRAIINLPEIATGQSEGFLNFFPESSGTVHKVPLFMALDGIPYPAMSLEVARIALGEKTLSLHPASNNTGERRGLLGLSIGDRFIPTDDQGQLTINYRGPWRSFPYLPVVELLEGSSLPDLNDTIVLIGTSAAGLLDLQTTPFSRIFPGVEIHANIIDNLLAGDPLRYDAFTEIGLTVTLILLGGILLSLLLARSGPLLGGLCALLFMLLCIAGNYQLLFRQGLSVGLTYPLLTLLLTCLVVTLSNYLLVERQKQFVHAAFRHYLAPQVVEQLLLHPEQLSLAGEEKELTVMFCDIRNFTKISEGMDSVSLANFMNRYLTEMTRLIIDGRGLLDKYIGDAVMAIWGAPLADAEHALRAVKTALQMQQQTAVLRETWRKEGLPEIHIGLGLNTGPMRVGNFGSEQLFDYTVIGDQVNLGSRLEGLSKVYGCGILISERTRQLIADEILCRPIDLVRVKGKQQPVAIFEPLRVGAAEDPEVSQWQQALDLYRQGQFTAASRELALLNQSSPHPLYQLYLERCEGFLLEPPPADWDGCFVHQSK